MSRRRLSPQPRRLPMLWQPDTRLVGWSGAPLQGLRGPHLILNLLRLISQFLRPPVSFQFRARELAVSERPKESVVTFSYPHLDLLL